MNKVGAFLLGMLFGMIVLVGSLGLGIYIAVAAVKPSTIAPETSTYIGDLADKPLLDIYKELSNLYLSKSGVADENGRYYSLGEFCAAYHIDLNTALGMEIPQEIYDIPVIEFFNQNSDENGENGSTRALKQIKVSSIPAVINMFTTTDENGNPTINQNTLNTLSQFSILDLMAEDGIATVFADVAVADLLPSSFPPEDSDNKLMWAIGQASIGKMYASMGASESIYLQLKPNGALTALGTLPITDLLGGSEGTIAEILGTATVASLVDANGAINLDRFFVNIMLGDLLGCMRHQIEDVTAYTNQVILEKNTEDQIIWVVYGDGDDHYVKSNDDQLFYAAQLSCDETDPEHTHTSECYEFLWYNTTSVSADHSECDGRCLIKDGAHHKRITGIYRGLTDLTLSELTSGSADAILSKIEHLTLGELIDGEISGVMEAFKDMTIHDLLNGAIDDLYLGGFLSFKRVEVPGAASGVTSFEDSDHNIIGYIGQISTELVLSENGTLWYKAKKICQNTDSSHTCSRSCYSYVWMNGEVEAEDIMAKLADKKVSQLNDMDDTLRTLTLRDVLGNDGIEGSIFEELADTQIGEISNKINDLYLGSVLGCMRAEIVDAQLATYNQVILNDSVSHAAVLSDGTNFVKTDGDDKYYKAQLTCTKTEEHTIACYEYVWYNKTVLGDTHDHTSDELIVDTEHHALITGIYKALVNMKLDDLMGGSSDAILNKVKGLTIGELMGDGEVTGIMANLVDMTIDEVMTGGVETLYLGAFLDYTRITITAPASTVELENDSHEVVGYIGAAPLIDGGIAMSDDGEKWYKAKIVCTDEAHLTHTQRDCYSYIWMNGSDEAEGMMAKLADKKVGNLGDMDSTIKSLTLADVLGRENLDGMLLEMADVKINDISTEIHHLYLGSAMNYHRQRIEDHTGYTLVSGFTDVKQNGTNYLRTEDGETWYAAEFTCIEEHVHVASCYEYLWFDQADAPVSGVTKAFVNATLDTIDDTMDNMTIGKLGLGGENNLMKALENTKLNDLGSAIDEIQLGVVFGYERKEESVSISSLTLVYAEDATNPYSVYKNAAGTAFYIESKSVLYQANYICTLAEGPEHTHSATCYDYVWYEDATDPATVVVGVNGKMASKTLASLTDGNGLTAIVTALTIGDLIDSGMMEIGETPAEVAENSAKFDIIFCPDSSATFSENITTILGAQSITYHCNLEGFVTYMSSHSGQTNATAVYFYSQFTHSPECHDSWKQMLLVDFISQLLMAIK